MEAGAAKLGYSLEVSYFPDGVLISSPSQEDIINTKIASISIVMSDEVDNALVDSISGATKRVPYLEREVSNDTLEELKNLNDFSNLDFGIIYETEEKNELKDILISGVLVESQNESAMLETKNVFRYTTYQKNRQPYGLSLHSDNPSILKRTLLEFLASTMPQSWKKDGEFWYARDSKNIDSTNYFGIVKTTSNSRINQINVGLLYGRIKLFALNNGLTVQPTYQVLQKYSDMAELNNLVHDKFADEGQIIQLIFRFGETDIDIPFGFRFDVNNIVQ